MSYALTTVKRDEMRWANDDIRTKIKLLIPSLVLIRCRQKLEQLKTTKKCVKSNADVVFIFSGTQ